FQGLQTDVQTRICGFVRDTMVTVRTSACTETFSNSVPTCVVRARSQVKSATTRHVPTEAPWTQGHAHATAQIEVLCEDTVCVNGGTPDNTTSDCNCTCPDGYYGDRCEKRKCPDEFFCSRFLPLSFCKYTNMQQMCPGLCGLCDRTIICNDKTCYNGGTLDTESCQCNCPDRYAGDTCETVTCQNEIFCNYLPVALCSYSNIRSMCAQWCGVCGERT
ncbi:hypothetical protein BaRGS_00001450, partial [Batillaria attramentaria]